MYRALGASILVGVMLAAVNAQQRSYGNVCSSAPQDRSNNNCGGSTERECVSRGCCWQECHGCDVGAPPCYQPTNAYSSECLVADEEKGDCGSYGIDQVACIQLGCCWAPSRRVDVPWCFRRKEVTTQSTTTTTTTERGPGSYRLVDGEGPWEGRLEVPAVGGVLGTFCNYNMGSNFPDVICRHFGFQSGGVMKYFPGGTGWIVADTAVCAEGTDHIDDCEFRLYPESCTHEQDVGVSCVKDAEINYD